MKRNKKRKQLAREAISKIQSSKSESYDIKTNARDSLRIPKLQDEHSDDESSNSSYTTLPESEDEASQGFVLQSKIEASIVSF